MITLTVDRMQRSRTIGHGEDITHRMEVIKRHVETCRERILQATKKTQETQVPHTQNPKIIDEEVTRTVNDLNSNPTTKPLISIEPEPLKAFLAEKAKDRADAIFDDALLLKIRNRVKAQINKALVGDFEEFHRKQSEVLGQHLEGDNAAAVLDGTVINEGGA
ncbi:hypothetical protein D6D19_09086 [Aureobasidium pullulans]|uniref:Uncharacterized protein n=1 Tax=Aureobasidium pullulans TaxID=5580 RepID=A0A4S8ZP31_AURPU|nr:hypothetical protein D6D19_09086 [Aureobasidium pullulans]